MRLEGKTALIMGGGQTPGETMGNGRACALLFAREGARVVVADRRLDSAEETVRQVHEAGGEAFAAECDVTDETAIERTVQACLARWERLDILHNNVGVSVAGGDVLPDQVEQEGFDKIVAINLRGTILACKHALKPMIAQGSGAICNISSAAAFSSYPFVGYKTTKAAMVAYTEQVAYQYARNGVRANCILPGLMDTPMAVDTRARAMNVPREQIAEERSKRVPLGKQMGTAWDVAYAALFLNSDEAKFITGVSLPVDGGTSVRVG